MLLILYQNEFPVDLCRHIYPKKRNESNRIRSGVFEYKFRPDLLISVELIRFDYQNRNPALMNNPGTDTAKDQPTCHPFPTRTDNDQISLV